MWCVTMYGGRRPDEAVVRGMDDCLMAANSCCVGMHVQLMWVLKETAISSSITECPSVIEAPNQSSPKAEVTLRRFRPKAALVNGPATFWQVRDLFSLFLAIADLNHTLAANGPSPAPPPFPVVGEEGPAIDAAAAPLPP